MRDLDAAGSAHALVDLELDHAVEVQPLLAQHVVERLGLRDRARETVEDEAVLGVRLVDAVGDDRNDDVVGDESPRSMMSLAFSPTGVPALTAARSMSPVESCTIPCLATRR